MHKRSHLWILLASTLLLGMPLAAEDMTVDEIIAKNIEAKGGYDAWKALESAHITGTMSMAAHALFAVVAALLALKFHRFTAAVADLATFAALNAV